MGSMDKNHSENRAVAHLGREAEVNSSWITINALFYRALFDSV